MSKFQQRHYEAIASLMQELRRDAEDQALPTVVRFDKLEDGLVDLFRRDNYLFMPERFRRACQPGANVKARTSNLPVHVDCGPLCPEHGDVRDTSYAG